MLNPEQKAAVTYTEGPLLVLAGAGSGKTRVIIHKIAHLIERCQYKAPSIYAVTFTNKAALEMKHRVQTILPANVRRGLNISTFHTLGLRIIKQNPEYCARHQSFSILDSEDCLALIQTFLPPARKRDREALRQIQQQISIWKNALLTPEEAAKQAIDADEQEVAILYQSYQRLLQTYNAVDFDDLIGMPVMLLKQHAEVRMRWQSRIRHLLIDEYQDSNHAQYQLVKLLVGKAGCFTAVGDDAQSIYAWRGANPEHLLELEKDFPDLKRIVLEQNYRSTGQILAAANQLIAQNASLFEKRLWSEHGPGEPVRVLCCKNGEDEVRQVVADLINHRLRHGRAYNDYAILYRSNHQARLFENMLRLHSIPYHITGGESWFARAEVKDILAYIKLLSNEQDDAAFLRVINTPKRGIGTTTLETLSQYAKNRGQSMYNSAHQLAFLSQLNDKSRHAIETFKTWFETLKSRSLQEPVIGVLHDMIKSMGYENHLYDLHENPNKAQKCMTHVFDLVALIQRLLEKKPEHGLHEVLNTLMLMDILTKDQENDTVQLMTLHASKGLEFPFVYLVGVEEELLPHRTSIESNQIEEERRLAYVGITRAERQLTISYAERRSRGGELQQCTPSRFLDELPEENIEWYGRPNITTPEESKKRAALHLAGMKALLGINT